MCNNLNWLDASNVGSRQWTCGYCGREVAGNVGYKHESDEKHVLICPHCQNATSFLETIYGVEQYPPATYGKRINSLPHNIEVLYGEICRCVQYSAFTGAVLLMRKMLIHLAVEQGAKENTSFASAVNFLDEKGWIPPTGKPWVDKIRSIGNDATHHVNLSSERDAEQLLRYVELLLVSIYEFPAEVTEND